MLCIFEGFVEALLTTTVSFYGIVEKVHCVWLCDGELQVIFECKGSSDRHENLLSMYIKFISNKNLVQEYLDAMQFIPHFKKVVTMKPTAELRIL